MPDLDGVLKVGSEWHVYKGGFKTMRKEVFRTVGCFFFPKIYLRASTQERRRGRRRGRSRLPAEQ